MLTAITNRSHHSALFTINIYFLFTYQSDLWGLLVKYLSPVQWQRNRVLSILCSLLEHLLRSPQESFPFLPPASGKQHGRLYLRGSVTQPGYGTCHFDSQSIGRTESSGHTYLQGSLEKWSEGPEKEDKLG